jgi:hypothetical protein
VKKSDLKRIIRRVVSEGKSTQRDRQLKRIASHAIKKAFLKEHTIPSKEADINDMDASAVWDIMTGDNVEEAQSLLDRIGGATGWGSGALSKKGITGETIKSKAEEIFVDKATFEKRVGEIVGKLNGAEGFSKPEMPALEGGDAAALQDALDEEGEYNIDIGADFGGDTDNFSEYAKEKVDDSEASPEEKKEKKEESNWRKGDVLLERWNKIAGLNVISEIESDPRFPFPGAAKVMPGAHNLGDKGTIDLGKTTGIAKAFLTKGKGNEGDDISITQNQSMKNSKMKPTQTNVKAAKSMLFALGDIGQDMEGAFASNQGEIIDGHHRWSGQHLRTGGEVDMLNVHIVDKAGMNTPEFLTMLTVVGNAMGRPTKTS